jgi:hypothetical protein
MLSLDVIYYILLTNITTLLNSIRQPDQQIPSSGSIRSDPHSVCFDVWEVTLDSLVLVDMRDTSPLFFG